MPRVTLIGYRGTGKSTVAALLACDLGCGWKDADTALESRAGSSIAQLVRERGEPAFRDLESLVLADLLAAVDGVLATGGGVVLRPENRRLLRGTGSPVVWLTAAPDVIRRRLAADPFTATQRPALTGGDPLAEIEAALTAREPLYRECADAVIDVSSVSPREAADRIVRLLPAGQPGGDPRRPS